MNNKQVAGAFARGEKGKSNNMFINGDKIYSYGYHFTIAKRLPNDCRITIFYLTVKNTALPRQNTKTLLNEP